eukprot:Gb_06129 [translate_table: standard]
MAFYGTLFSQLDVASSQPLVIDNKFKDIDFRRQLSETIVSLLELHVVLIFNENDAVSTRKAPYEGAIGIFWDNDSFTTLLAFEEKHDRAIKFSDKSKVGRGGMTTKVKPTCHAALDGTLFHKDAHLWSLNKEQSTREMAFLTRDASRHLQGMSSFEQRRTLLDVANALKANEDIIRRENEFDVLVAQEERIAELLSGNELFLKGGKEAARSNAILHKVITEAVPESMGRELIGLVTSRDEIPGPPDDSSSGNVKFMCNFGGKILPRANDGKLRYVGGETRIITVNKDIAYGKLMQKMVDGYDQVLILKYQLPDEDLDALGFVSSDEDLDNMIEEYDMSENSEGSSSL